MSILASPLTSGGSRSSFLDLSLLTCNVGTVLSTLRGASDTMAHVRTQRGGPDVVGVREGAAAPPRGICVHLRPALSSPIWGRRCGAGLGDYRE